MLEVWISTLVSTIAVSAIAGIGILFFIVNYKFLKKIMFLLVSFAVGALLGNVFFHLLPEVFEEHHSQTLYGIVLLSGLLAFFVTERVFHWHHHHQLDDEQDGHHVHSFGYVSLFADALHNFTDGVLIAAAWMTGPEIGMATTLAVMLHEIPQEISDFSILVHAGFTKRKALMFNLLSALTAVVGAVVTLLVGQAAEHITSYILPFAAGGFIYLACSDLIPELNKQPFKTLLIQLLAIAAGAALMIVLVAEHSH